VKVMREVPGFVDYYAFDAGGRVVASVAVFADRTGLEEAERRLAGWVEQTVSELDQHPSGGLATAGTWPCRIAQAPFGAPASSKSPKPARAI
jgi:hypothetical protein